MYAIRPWNKACLIGSTIGSLTLGIGMRWRESVVEVIEKRSDPVYETDLMRRCVIPEHGFKILGDLGCNTDILRKQFQRAKRWKIVTPDMLTIREGNMYPGCSPAEPVYTTTEGQLLRALRREYVRYGGHLQWGSEAHEPYASPEAKESVCVAKDFGPVTDVEAAICFVKNQPHFHQIVFSPLEEDARAAVFQVKSGVCEAPVEDLQALFGHEYDFCIAMGKEMALHVYMPKAATFSWRLVTAGKEETANTTLLHPALQHMISISRNVVNRPVVVPADTPTFSEELIYQRVSMMGEALLPVDPFEWRGDRAMIAIENSAEICQSFYKKKYYRGHVPAILREAETDQLMRRADLLRRDMRDAEMFLAEHPMLEADDDDAEPQLKRVGA